MISRVFIDRPNFAWVLAIMIMLGGVAAILTMPIEQYPDVAPPSVSIAASYPGASAETLESSVTQVIEQQLTGIDGLIYFTSTSSSEGTVSIDVTFEKGTDPDIAQVQVQNKAQQALSRLPQEVQLQGLTVTKANNDFLLITALYDETDRTTAGDVSDFLVSNLQDPIGRLPGIGSTQIFGAQYAMRIWLDPFKLRSVSLMPSDVIAAIRAQNTQVAAGQLGSTPSSNGQMLNAIVTARSRLTTADQFRNIIVKTRLDGSTVRMSDVARVELGQESYAAQTRYNRHPASGIAVSLAPGADALETAEAVKALVAERSTSFPAGYKFAFPQDSTEFIRISIEEVLLALAEAIFFVVIVMFVFLQGWRATLIPTIAVPVVLLGTFGVLALFGYTINTLTLFGLVLAIGLLVDDAIVVVENVERVMEENPDISPRDATIESMAEIQTALIGIALVLSAVFLPMVFFGGSTGVIYRQFAITIMSAMILSAGVALILTPALTATLLKREEKREDGAEAPRRNIFMRVVTRARDWFNDAFARTTKRYVAGVERTVRRWIASLVAFGGVIAALVLLFVQLPTGFLPTEDLGYGFVQVTLPPGATEARTSPVMREVEDHYLGAERANLEGMFSVSGFSLGGAGQNVGLGFVKFAPWDDRKGAENGAPAITDRASGQLATVRDAQIFALSPPSISGLGQSNGFTMQLQNTGGLSQTDFLARRDQLLAAATGEPTLVAVRPGGLEDGQTLRVVVDQAKVGALGVAQGDVDATLAAAWGGVYVNDFFDRGRVKRVYVQGDAGYRGEPDDLSDWFVRAQTGQMAPFSTFTTTSWSKAPTTLTRFNGISSYEIQGQAAPGYSSGDAIARITELAAKIPGTSVEWSGLSYQEQLSAGQAPLLYSLSILLIFLVLVALYESWSIPLSVLLVIPLGLVGAVAAVTLRGLENDVYLQVGLLTTMGLAAKNAILIVEFAEQGERAGKSPLEAVLEASRQRLRPILMTSLAFTFGVLPLAIATGAGAQSRIAIGTAVIGGMITATILAIFYVPLFFVLVRRLVARKRLAGDPEPDGDPTPVPSGPRAAAAA